MNAPRGALARAYEDESNNLADVRVWHFCDIARSGTNVCFRRKSGHVADITTMTGFDRCCRLMALSVGSGMSAPRPRLRSKADLLRKPTLMTQNRHYACRSGPLLWVNTRHSKPGPLSGSFLWPAHAWRGRVDGHVAISFRSHFVARMERSVIRDLPFQQAPTLPDFAALHPGYTRKDGCLLDGTPLVPP